ncbi:MAG: hypothetical protein ACO4AU_15870, partial [bacterium]
MDPYRLLQQTIEAAPVSIPMMLLPMGAGAGAARLVGGQLLRSGLKRYGVRTLEELASRNPVAAQQLIQQVQKTATRTGFGVGTGAGIAENVAVEGGTAFGEARESDKLRSALRQQNPQASYDQISELQREAAASQGAEVAAEQITNPGMLATNAIQALPWGRLTRRVPGVLPRTTARMAAEAIPEGAEEAFQGEIQEQAAENTLARIQGRSAEDVDFFTKPRAAEAIIGGILGATMVAPRAALDSWSEVKQQKAAELEASNPQVDGAQTLGQWEAEFEIAQQSNTLDRLLKRYEETPEALSFFEELARQQGVELPRKDAEPKQSTESPKALEAPQPRLELRPSTAGASFEFKEPPLAQEPLPQDSDLFDPNSQARQTQEEQIRLIDEYRKLQAQGPKKGARKRMAVIRKRLEELQRPPQPPPSPETTLAPEEQSPQELEAPANTQPGTPGYPRPAVEPPREIVTPRLTALQVERTVVELAELQQARGDLQPRDRQGRQQNSEDGARERATYFDPPQVVDSTRTSESGPPIVTPSGVVISGNGRLMTLDLLYNDPQYQKQREAYEQAIAPDVEKSGQRFEQPVVVNRILLNETTDRALLTRFARESNTEKIAKLSTTET